MGSPLRLLHFANSKSTNIGNGALILGAETAIGEDFPRAIEWEREPWDDYTFDKRRFDAALVERINTFDAMVVGGAVSINGRDYLRNAGMRFDLPFELWPRLRKPIVFYGLSYRHWAGQPFHHLDKLKQALDYILAAPNMMFSVRNDGTAAWLEDLCGLPSGTVTSIPDPGLYVPTATDEDYIELPRDRINVMIAFNNEDAVYRYGGRGREYVSRSLGAFLGDRTAARLAEVASRYRARRDHIVAGMVYAVERIAKEWNAHFVLVPHYFDDYRMLSDFVSRCRPQVAHQAMLSTGLTTLDGTRRFYGRYARANLAVSMRVHSMSPAIGLGVPTVPFVTQDRIWDFLRAADLADVGVDAFADDVGDRLHTAMNAALKEPQSLRDRFAGVRKRFRSASRDYHARMAKLFSA